MEKPSYPAPDSKTISISLTASDLKILDKFRGELSQETFISALLRMIDSGSIQSTPDWVKGGKND
jgi:hypothetical protein